MNLRDSLKNLVKEDVVVFEPCVTRYKPIKDINGNLVTIRDDIYYLDKIASTVTVEPINRVGFPNEAPYPNYIYEVEYSPASEPSGEGTEVLVAFTNQGRGYIVSSSKVKVFSAEEFRKSAKTLTEAKKDNPNVKLGSADTNNADGYVIFDREGFAIDLANQEGYFVMYKDGLYNYESLKVHLRSKYGVLLRVGGGKDSTNLDLLVPPTGIVRMAKTDKVLKSKVFSTETSITDVVESEPILKIPKIKDGYKDSLPEIERITNAVLFKEDIVNFNRVGSLAKLEAIEIGILTIEGKRLLASLKGLLSSTTSNDAIILARLYKTISDSYISCYEPIKTGDLEKYLTNECKEEIIAVMDIIAKEAERVLKLGGYNSDSRLIPLKSEKYMDSPTNRKLRDNSFNAILRKLGSLRYANIYLSSLSAIATIDNSTTISTVDKTAADYFGTAFKAIGFSAIAAGTLAIAAPYIASALATTSIMTSLGGATALGGGLTVGGGTFAANALVFGGAAGFGGAGGVTIAVGSIAAGGGAIGTAVGGTVFGITLIDSTTKKDITTIIEVPKDASRKTYELITKLIELLAKNPPTDMVATTVKAEEVAVKDVEVSVSLLSIIEQLNTTIKEFGDSITKVLSTATVPSGGGALLLTDPAFVNTLASLTGNLSSLTKATESLLGKQSDYVKGKF